MKPTRFDAAMADLVMCSADGTNRRLAARRAVAIDLARMIRGLPSMFA